MTIILGMKEYHSSRQVVYIVSEMNMVLDKFSTSSKGVSCSAFVPSLGSQPSKSTFGTSKGWESTRESYCLEVSRLLR